MKNAFPLLFFLMLLSCANRSVGNDVAPLSPDSTGHESDVVDELCDTSVSLPNGSP